MVEAFAHEHTHSIGISHFIDFLLLISSVLLELFQNLKGWRDVTFPLTVFLNEPSQCNSELLSDHSLDARLEYLIWLLVPEEIKVSLFLLELLTDEVELICKLIVLTCQLEEVLPRYLFNNAMLRLRNKLLKLLRIITDEAIGAETGTLYKITWMKTIKSK